MTGRSWSGSDVPGSSIGMLRPESPYLRVTHWIGFPKIGLSQAIESIISPELDERLDGVVLIGYLPPGGATIEPE